MPACSGEAGAWPAGGRGERRGFFSVDRFGILQALGEDSSNFGSVGRYKANTG